MYYLSLQNIITILAVEQFCYLIFISPIFNGVTFPCGINNLRFTFFMQISERQ